MSLAHFQKDALNFVGHIDDEHIFVPVAIEIGHGEPDEVTHEGTNRKQCLSFKVSLAISYQHRDVLIDRTEADVTMSIAVKIGNEGRSVRLEMSDVKSCLIAESKDDVDIITPICDNEVRLRVTVDIADGDSEWMLSTADEEQLRRLKVSMTIAKQHDDVLAMIVDDNEILMTVKVTVGRAQPNGITVESKGMISRFSKRTARRVKKQTDLVLRGNGRDEVDESILIEISDDHTRRSIGGAHPNYRCLSKRPIAVAQHEKYVVACHLNAEEVESTIVVEIRCFHIVHGRRDELRF